MCCDWSVTRLRRTLTVFALVAAGCSSTTVQLAQEPEVPTTISSTTTTSEVAATEKTPTTLPETTTVTEPTEESVVDCTTVTDFTDTAANARWIVVNDNVMGGRSLGDRTFTDDTMVFSGSINTDGGGFASLRLPLEPDLMATADRMVFRARSDGRSYVVTFDDSVDRFDRRVSYRAPIEFEATGEWETATVMLDDLFAASFGVPVEAEPFRKDLATRMGIMLSDGVDGAFTLELDSIELCG